MSKIIKMSLNEKEVYKKYKIPSCSPLFKRKVNDWNFSKANSPIHELTKFKIAFEIFRNGGKFIMEAERLEKCNGKRRIIDVVDLSSNIEFEVETTPERAKRFIGDYSANIKVIPAGWTDKDKIKWVKYLNEVGK